MLKNKFLFANSSVPVSELAGSPVKTFNWLTRSLVNPLTRLLANRLTILLLCFLCLFSISLAQEQFAYDSKGKRDPFIPLVTPDGRLLKLEQQEGVIGLLVEGIIYDKQGVSYAIVNGEVVKIGDKIGEYQVFKIENNKIIFLKEGEPVELELKEEEP